MSINGKALLVAIVTGIAMLAAVLSYAAFADAAIISQMQPGDHSTAVSELQSYLAADATVYPEGLVTGYFGSLTEAAVQRFQCKYGIVCGGGVLSTGFGRVGAMTLSRIQAFALGTPGIPNTGGGEDTSAPAMSKTTVVTTDNSAAIHWSTNEPGNHSVYYGSSWPFFIDSAERGVDMSYDTGANIILTGLLPHHTYYFVRKSIDGSGNVQYGIDESFTTK